MTNRRRLINIIFSLIVTISILAFTITLFTFIPEEDKEPSHPIMGYVNLNDGVLTDDDYNNYSIFSISTPQGLMNFAESVNSGYTFYQKDVMLYSDIDMSGYNWEPIGDGVTNFEGCFDGRGYTIKNLTCNERLDASWCSLFYGLSGVKWKESHWSDPNNYTEYYPYVQNLRIADMTLLKDSYNYEGFTGAALAIKVGGDMQISNVEVDGLTVKAKTGYKFSPRIIVGGIVAYVGYDNYNDYISSDVLIENCYVEDFNVTMATTIDDGYVSFGHYSVEACVAGIGPAAMHYVEGKDLNKCTVKNSVFKKSSSTWKITGDVSVLQRDIAIHDAPAYNNISGSKLSAQVVDCYSSATNALSDFNWFYDSTFNNGFPRLQKWIGSDARFDFSPSTDDNGGKVVGEGFDEDDGELYFFRPLGYRMVNGVKQTYVTDTIDVIYESSNSTIKIGDLTITAEPSTGYKFSGWTYSVDNSENFPIYQYQANFEMITYNLTFEDLHSQYSDITVTGSLSHVVNYNTAITLSKTENSNGTTLKYSFNDSTGTAREVTYQVPIKYNVTYYGDTSNVIGGDREIDLTISVKMRSVTFKKVDGSNYAGTSLSVEYGSSLECSISTTKIEFKIADTTIAYNRIDGYWQPVGYKVDSVPYTTNKTFTITKATNVESMFTRLYDVQFDTIENAELNASTNPIKIPVNSSFTYSYSGYPDNTIEYKYNGTVVATYKLDPYYRLTNADLVENIQANETITPEIEFYACKVTMVTTNMATINDASPFIVEFGTIVEFDAQEENSIFTYTYTFKTNGIVVKTITYTMINDKLAMVSTTDGSNRVWDNGLNGLSFTGPTGQTSPTPEQTNKTITPSFDYKEYIFGMG